MCGLFLLIYLLYFLLLYFGGYVLYVGWLFFVKKYVGLNLKINWSVVEIVFIKYNNRNIKI